MLALIKDIHRMVGKHKLRLLTILFSRAFLGILTYRTERFLYTKIGKYYKIIRIPFIPILTLSQAYSNIDIHYQSEIGGGLLILHPSLGIVISGKVKIGTNLTLTGGNTIGIHGPSHENSYIIGNNCNIGANATIIGPLKLGNNTRIGASACVTKSFLHNNITLIGVPARILST